MKIHNKYINEAKRIRSDYLNFTNFIKKEKLIEKYKNRILNLLESMEKFIEKNEELDEESLKEKLNDELMDMNTNMEKIQNDVKILDENIKKLKTQSKQLYATISTEYPNLDEKKIQKQILYSLDK